MTQFCNQARPDVSYKVQKIKKITTSSEVSLSIIIPRTSQLQTLCQGVFFTLYMVFSHTLIS